MRGRHAGAECRAVSPHQLQRKIMKQKEESMRREPHCRAVSPQCAYHHVRKFNACPRQRRRSEGDDHCELQLLERKLTMAYYQSDDQQPVKILPGKEFHYNHDHREGQSHMLDCVQGLISLVLRFGSYLGRCVRGGVQGYLICVQTHTMYSYTLSNICNGKTWGTNPRPNMYVVYVITNELKPGFGSSCLIQR